MIARRLAALAMTVALIAGAYLIRSRIIDGDTSADAPPTSSAAATLVCIEELADVCRSHGDLVTVC